MTARLRNQQRYGDDRRSGDSDCAANGEIKRVRRRRGPCDAPFDIDCVIVGRVSGDGVTGSLLRRVNMLMRG